MPSAVVGILRVLLTANTAEFETAMKQAGTTAKAWTKDLKAIGSQATAAGTTLTAALTVPLAGVGFAAVKAAGDYQHAFQDVIKTTEGSREAFATLNQDLRDLALAIPQTAVDLAGIAAIGGQFGVAIGDLENFTKTIANLGVAVDGISTEDAAAGLAQVAKVSGIANQDIGRLASSLVELGNRGTSTESMILEFSKRLAGAGHQIGLSGAEVMGLGAAMANLGINAEAGGTAMSRVMAKMERAVESGGTALERFAEVAHMSAENFANLFRNEPIKAIEAFVAGLGSAKDEGKALTLVLDDLGIKDVRMVDAMKRLASASGEIATQVRLSTDAFTEGNRHTEEAEKKYKTFWNQLKLLQNAVTDIAIEFGNALIPTLETLVHASKPVLEIVRDLAEGFSHLSPGLQTLIIGFGAFVAAIGPALVALGLMATGLSTITALFATKGIALRGLTALLTPFTTGTLGVVGALGLLTTVLQGLVLGGLLAGLVWGITQVIEAYEKLQRFKGSTWEFLTQRDEDNFVRRFLGLSNGINDLNTKLRELKAAALDPAVEALLKLSGTIAPLGPAMLDAGKGAIVYGDGFMVAEDATNTFREEMARAKKEMLGLTDAQKAAIVEGTKANKSAKELAEILPVSEAAIALYKDSIKNATKATKEQVEAEEKWQASVKHGFGVPADYFGNLPQFHAAVEEVRASVHDLVAEGLDPVPVNTFGTALAAAAKQEEEFAKQGGVMHAAVKEVRADLEKPIGKTFIQVIGDSLHEFPNLLKKALTGGGDLGGAFKALFSDIGADLMGEKGPFGPMLANLGKSVGGGLSKVFGDTIGKSLGAIIPGLGEVLGSMLGPLMGKVGGWFKSLFGGVSAEVQQARTATKDFEETIIGTLTASQQAEAGGERWKQVVIGIRDAYLATGHTAAEADAITRQLWNTDNPAAAKAAIEAINAVFKEQNALVETQQADLAALTAQYESYSQELAGLQAESEITWEKMRDAAGRYGIELSGLGPAFQNARLHETAQTIWDDFILLTRGGADVGTVLTGMKDEIVQLATESTTFGVQIPDNFRPLIANLLESTVLTDQERVALQQLGDENFGDPIVSALDQIGKRMGELVGLLTEISGKLGSNVPQAANTAGAAIEASMRNRAIPALEDTADAVNAVVQMASPTGLEGMAVYADLAAAAIANLGTSSVQDLAQMQRAVNVVAGAEGERGLVALARNADLASEAFGSLSDAALEDMLQVQKSVQGVSGDLAGLIAKMGEVAKVAPGIISKEESEQWAGFAKLPTDLMTEADAIGRVNEVFEHFWGRAASGEELGAMAGRIQYTGGGNIVASALDDFLKDVQKEWVASNIHGIQVLGLQEGGIITRPTLAMIGEGHEPEAVMPLSQLEAGAGAGGGFDPTAMVSGIAREIDRLMTRYDMTMRVALRDAAAGAL